MTVSTVVREAAQGLWQPISPTSQQSSISRELRTTPHCAVYLETTEKLYRGGSIPDHAFKIRPSQGFPAELSPLVIKGSNFAHQ